MRPPRSSTPGLFRSICVSAALVRLAGHRPGVGHGTQPSPCSSDGPTGVGQRLVELEQELYHDKLPRVALLETEYLRAVTAAELTWLTSVLDDLRSGSVAWSAEDFDPAKFELPGDELSQ